ncbi:MAG: methyltransferase domain-containing protein [Bacteroidales bacterium]|nr:methyltransferase domain-containing protein [Bacteroidales bacterium]
MLKYKTKYDLDSSERTLFHREIILNKPFLKKIYVEWYRTLVQEIRSVPDGKVVELGSGGGFLKNIVPSVITSDIIPLPHTDLTFSALQMPFQDSEVSVLFLLDTFHHIPDANQFLKESDRVLKKGGKIVMIEPANSAWGRFIYKNFHHEPFDENGEWTIPGTGPMSGANGALPWIVFRRDVSLFADRFPDLKIESITYHTPLRYLLSGGVAYKAPFPGWSFGFFTLLDRVLLSLSQELSMFMTIRIVKR